MDVYERANIRPTRKEQSTQNQTKMCAIIVFDVCFELYAEPLFGNVGLNGSLKRQNEKACTLVNATGVASYVCNGFIAQVIMEISPTAIENGKILLTGLPRPITGLYMSLPMVNGNDIPCVLNYNGELVVYYRDESHSNISRVDHSFLYLYNK